MRRCARTLFLVCLLVLLLTSVCSADVGIVLILLTPFIPVALIVVILTEVWVFKMALGRPYRRIYAAVSVANMLSTAVGYPISWFLSMAALMLSFELDLDQEGLWIWTEWTGPLACGLILTFFASVHLEYFVVRSFYRNEDRVKIKRLSYKANLITYALLLAALLTLTLLYSV